MKRLKKRIICFLSAGILLASAFMPASVVLASGPDTESAKEYFEADANTTEISGDPMPTENSMELKDVAGIVEHIDSDRRIVLSYPEDADIPSDAELFVNISDDRLEAASEILDLSAEDYVYYSEFIDMELMCGGEKVIPAAPVMISIEIPDAAGDAVFRTVRFDETCMEEIACETLDKAVVFITPELSGFGVIGAVPPAISESRDAAELSVFTLDNTSAVIADGNAMRIMRWIPILLKISQATYRRKRRFLIPPSGKVTIS